MQTLRLSCAVLGYCSGIYGLIQVFPTNFSDGWLYVTISIGVIAAASSFLVDFINEIKK